MNLAPPSGKKFLFLSIDATDKTIKYIKIPRDILRNKLFNTIPDLWVTKYEMLRPYPSYL